MKRENQKMAQERRAKERKKQSQKRIIDKFLKIGLPIILFVIFVGILVIDPFSSTDTDTDNSVSTNTETTSDTDTDTTSYLTDSSLTIEDGDTVNIDFVGTIDGVEFSGGNTNGAGTDLVIGSGSYIDDFEEQLIGAHPGDTVEVNVTFPEDYGKEELNGQDAVFEVVINGIYE